MQGKHLPRRFEVCFFFFSFFFFLHIHLGAVVTPDVVFVPARAGAECGAVQERLQGSAGGDGAQGEGADTGTLHA